MPPSFSSALLYRSHAWVHWAPRQAAASAAISALQNSNSEITRVVDIGCDGGVFYQSAEALKLGYLGIEPDPVWQTASASDREGVPEIKMGTARDIAAVLRPGDVILLNGVAHHLDDQEWQAFLRASRTACGLVVLDHVLYREANLWLPLIPKTLQRFDLGKFIRPTATFRNLPAWRNTSFRTFNIQLFGLTLWPYFVASYEPIDLQG